MTISIVSDPTLTQTMPPVVGVTQTPSSGVNNSEITITSSPTSVSNVYFSILPPLLPYKIVGTGALTPISMSKKQTHIYSCEHPKGQQ